MAAMISYFIVAMFPGTFFTKYKLLFAMQATGDNARQDALDQYDAVIALRGLDKPWYTQFYYWVEGIVRHGRLGFSFNRGEPVLHALVGGQGPLKWTLIIIGSSVLVGWIVGVPLGVFGAACYRHPAEVLLSSTIYAISAIPPFTLGLTLFVLYNMLHPEHWLLPGAWGMVSQEFLHSPLSWAKALSHLHRLSLTWLLVSTPIAVIVSRHLRASLLEVLAQPFIRTALSKGASRWRILIKHALRNALNPLVSMSGFMLTETIGNSIVASIVLYQPNLGSSLVYYTRVQDQPVLTGILILFSGMLVIGVLISDLLLAALDPRIRYNWQSKSRNRGAHLLPRIMEGLTPHAAC